MYRPAGDLRTAKYVIVGEAPAATEIQQGRPFVGPSGQIFDEALRNAGINRFDCYITNVFNAQLTKNEKQKGKPWQIGESFVWSPMKGDFLPAGDFHRVRLLDELRDVTVPIVALGSVALKALTGKQPISAWRGSFLRADRLPNRPPLVATYHPATVLYGEDLNRWYILNDFNRAVRSARYEPPTYDFPSNLAFSDCIEHLNWLRNRGELFSCDIEVASRQVSMISYGWSERNAISIPYGVGGWTVEQELELWRATAALLEQPGIPKVFHNAAFDVQFLLQIHQIDVRGPIHDTMVLYAVLYPEFRKSLATLSSIYTDQPFWKHLVKHAEIEKEEG